MNRRTYLRGLAVGGLASSTALAGCSALPTGGGSGGSDSSSSTTVLPEPEDDYGVDPADLPYPAYGQQIPDVSLSAALHDGTESTRGYDSPLAMTFIYTTCMTACPVLTQALKTTHETAMEEGWAESTNFVEISFDPERDTPDALRTYAEERNLDVDTGRWHLLRPESYDAAKDVVSDQFGLGFEKTTPEDMDQYMFVHSTLILLVNADGYVERSYRDGQKAAQQLPADMERVVTA